MLVDLIQAHITRRGYSYGRIAVLSTKFSSTGATLLPKSTVQGWIKDYKHRLPLERLLVLARVLDLTANETNELLRASRHPEISRLLRTAEQDSVRSLLSHWDYRGQIFQAPREPAWFVGRHEDKNQIKQILRHSQTRLCFLYGEGGVGKSALAIRLAHEMRSEFPDGVLWGEVNGEASLLSILRSFAASFDYSLDQFSMIAQCHEQVRSLLQSKRCLVILDNIATAQELESLLPAKGSCSTLITLRDEALAKHYFQGTSYYLSRFARAESIELLMEILGQGRVQKEIKAAQQLIHFAEGLPLVLRLIGGALRSTTSLSLQGYAILLDNKLAELLDWERFSDRERKVRATFEVSYQRLLTAVQPVFVSLGLFQARNFSAHAVASINQLSLDEARLLLAQLSELSLIQEFPLAEAQITAVVSERYQMHALLQLFAYDKLQNFKPTLFEAGQNYYQAFVNDEIDSVIDHEWLNIAGFIEVANNKSDWLTLTNFVDSLTKLETSNIGYMDARGHYDLAFRCLSALLLQALETEKAILHYKCGVFALRLNLRDKALLHLQESERLLKEEERMEEGAVRLAAVYEHLARLHEQGDIEEVLSHVEAGLDILAPFEGRDVDLQRSALIVVRSTALCRTISSRDSVIETAKQGLELAPEYDSVAHLNALTNLAVAHGQKGNLNQAHNLFRDGIEYAKLSGNKAMMGKFYINLGIIERRKFNLAKAIEYQTQAKNLFEDLDEPRMIGATLNNLGKTLYVYGDDLAATGHLNQAIAISQENKLQGLEAVARTTLAQVQISQELFKKASDNLEAAYQIANQKKARANLIPYIYLYLGEIALCKGQFEKAKSLLKKAHKISENQEKVTEGLSLVTHGKVLSSEGFAQEATRMFEEGLAILADQDPYELACAQRDFVEHLQLHQHETHRQQIEFLSEESDRIFARIDKQKS